MSFKLGHIHSEETKKKIGKANKGNIPWLKGKHHSEETKKKLSMEKKGIQNGMFGKVPWNKDKSWDEKTKKKMSIAAKGRLAWNKGIEASEEAKKKMSESSKGQKAWNKGTKGLVIIKPETRHKLRIIHLNRTIKNIKEGGRVIPFYNSKACEYFKQFDKINNTSGQYATNGGELCILGYWLDYINYEKKLIIEWDEERHHYQNGKLRQKDIIKQKEIENQFPNYTFIRIREAEYIPKVNELFPRLVANEL